MNTQLIDAVREITHKRIIASMDDFTGDEIMGLTALYLDSLSVPEQLDIVVESNPEALLKNLKGVLRGEGSGAYGLMDPKNLLSHDIVLGTIRWAFDEIEDVLQEVITQESHDKGVY
jgi:hypothetical protein